MAKPVYGGWVTFTAHLNLKYNYPLFKIGKEQNLIKEIMVMVFNIKILRWKILQKSNLMITAIDKHYYEYLPYFPKGITF